MKTKSQFNPMAEGQMVIIIARWVLVVAALFLILLDSARPSLALVKFEIMVVLALAVSNFFLVAQVLTKRKTLDAVVYALGLADIGVITAIVIAQGGFESNVYTFYFPAILAFSVAFPTAVLYVTLGGTLATYGFIGILTAPALDDLQTVVLRLLMLAAVAVCGNYFARLERERRARLQNDVVLTRLSEDFSVPTAASQPVANH